MDVISAISLPWHVQNVSLKLRQNNFNRKMTGMCDSDL